MLRICSVCHRVIGTVDCPESGLSHGYCPEHLAAAYAEADRYFAEHPELEQKAEQEREESRNG